MRNTREIEEKIRALEASLDDDAGEDEPSASRGGKVNALKWVLGREKELTTETWYP